MNFSYENFPKTSPLKRTTSSNKGVNVSSFTYFDSFTRLEFGFFKEMYGSWGDKNIMLPSSACISSTSLSMYFIGSSFS